MDNGAVSTTGDVKQNTVVTVTCYERYVLIGDKEVTCQSTGWDYGNGSETMPVCKKCSKFDFKHMILIFLLEIQFRL